MGIRNSLDDDVIKTTLISMSKLIIAVNISKNINQLIRYAHPM